MADDTGSWPALPWLGLGQGNLERVPLPRTGTALARCEEQSTLSMCGKRNSRPECIPVPRPMEDRMPRPTHHTAHQNHSSTLSSSSVCCPAPSMPGWVASHTAHQHPGGPHAVCVRRASHDSAYRSEHLCPGCIRDRGLCSDMHPRSSSCVHWICAA